MSFINDYRGAMFLEPVDGTNNGGFVNAVNPLSPSTVTPPVGAGSVPAVPEVDSELQQLLDLIGEDQGYVTTLYNEESGRVERAIIDRETGDVIVWVGPTSAPATGGGTNGYVTTLWNPETRQNERVIVDRNSGQVIQVIGPTGPPDGQTDTIRLPSGAVGPIQSRFTTNQFGAPELGGITNAQPTLQIEPLLRNIIQVQGGNPLESSPGITGERLGTLASGVASVNRGRNFNTVRMFGGNPTGLTPEELAATAAYYNEQLRGYLDSGMSPGQASANVKLQNIDPSQFANTVTSYDPVTGKPLGGRGLSGAQVAAREEAQRIAAQAAGLRHGGQIRSYFRGGLAAVGGGSGALSSGGGSGGGGGRGSFVNDILRPGRPASSGGVEPTRGGGLLNRGIGRRIPLPRLPGPSPEGTRRVTPNRADIQLGRERAFGSPSSSSNTRARRGTPFRQEARRTTGRSNSLRGGGSNRFLDRAPLRGFRSGGDFVAGSFTTTRRSRTRRSASEREPVRDVSSTTGTGDRRTQDEIDRGLSAGSTHLESARRRQGAATSRQRRAAEREQEQRDFEARERATVDPRLFAHRLNLAGIPFDAPAPQIAPRPAPEQRGGSDLEPRDARSSFHGGVGGVNLVGRVPRFDSGGSMVAPEEIVGVGRYTGTPYFRLGENLPFAGGNPELLKIVPLKRKAPAAIASSARAS